VRRFCWPLILFQLVWLNVVLPGHTRGLVTVGQPCESPARCCAQKSKVPGSKSPTPDQQKRCAICAFAAALSTPPVINISLELRDVARSVRISKPASIASPDLCRSHRERAPPQPIA
jgi:hypothetical protein